MKAILDIEKFPKFLTIAQDAPEVITKYLKFRKGELCRVAPAKEQREQGCDLRKYVRVYVKRGEKWEYRVLGWQHLDYLKK